MSAVGSESGELVSAITHVSDPTPFGKTCVVTGDGWTLGAPQVRVCRFANGPIGKPGEAFDLDGDDVTVEPVSVVREEEQVLTCELPAEGFGVAALQTQVDGAWSKPFVINRPRVDWLSSDQIEAGDVLRAFGRNLVDLALYPEPGSDGAPVSHGGYVQATTSVVIRDRAGADIDCEVEKASAYDVHFRVPQELPAGEYMVYLHNGLGGSPGWSLPQPVKVAGVEQWPTETFDIRDYGAKGVCTEMVEKPDFPGSGRVHGVHDATAAVEAALEAARKNGGGVVFIPPGSYLVTRALHVPRYTVVRGESRARSWIWFPDGVDHGTREQGHACPVGFMGQSHFGFENLSIHGVFNKLMIAAPLSDTSAGGWNDLDKGTAGADHVFVRNCYVFQEPTYRYHTRKDDPFINQEVMCNESAWWDFAAIAIRGDHVSVTDCEIKGGGMPVMLKGCRFATIARNRLHTGASSNGFGVFGGDYPIDPMPDKCVFEDNQIRTGSSRNHSGFWNHWTGSRYYLARNSFKLFWVCDVEGILFHGGGKQAILDVKEADGAALVCEDAGPAESSWECVVVKGRGLGQSRMIELVSGNTIELDQPWEIEPDSSSRVAVLQCPCFREHIIVDNQLEDTGAGIHSWGNAIDWVIDGNQLTRTGGIELETCSAEIRPWSGVYFMHVTRNHLDQGRFYGKTGDMWTTGFTGTGYYRSYLDGTIGSVGHVYRGNLHQNDSTQAFWAKEFFREGQRQLDHISDTGMVVEENRFRDCAVGVYIGDGVSVLLRNNVFENVDSFVYAPESSLTSYAIK